MEFICSLSDADLVTRTVQLVHAERACAADVIEHLVEIDRRQLYLEQATSSLSAYCIERLGYSEDEAWKRVRIARLARRFPQVREELRTGAIHMTGLVFLAPHLNAGNFTELLEQARHKSKSEIEKLIATWFPKPDIPECVHSRARATLRSGCFAAPTRRVDRFRNQSSIDAGRSGNATRGNALVHAVLGQ